MIKEFIPGTLLRFKGTDVLARVADSVPKGSYGWKVRGYEGEGFYRVVLEKNGRVLIAHEEDLELVNS